MNLQTHPTVQKLAQLNGNFNKSQQAVLEADEWRKLIISFGADDVGFLSFDADGIADQKEDILKIFPKAQSLVSFVCRMNREPVRSPARSIANLEFHHAHDQTNEVAHWIVAELESRGIRAINPAMGFPMEMSGFPGKIWTTSEFDDLAKATGIGLTEGNVR